MRDVGEHVGAGLSGVGPGGVERGEQLIGLRLGGRELGHREQLLADLAVMHDLHVQLDDVVGPALDLGDLLDQPGHLHTVDVAVVLVDAVDLVAGLTVELDLLVQEARRTIEPLLGARELGGLGEPHDPIELDAALVLARRQQLERQLFTLLHVEVPVQQRVFSQHRKRDRIFDHEHLRLRLHLPAGLAIEAALEHVVADDHAPVHLTFGGRVQDELPGRLLAHALGVIVRAVFLGAEDDAGLDGALGELAKRLCSTAGGDVTVEQLLRRRRRGRGGVGVVEILRDRQTADSRKQECQR